MDTKKIKEIGRDLIAVADDIEDKEDREKLSSLKEDLNTLLEELQEVLKWLK